MPILPIRKIGHPELLTVSKKVTEFDNKELNELIADMTETMRTAKGVGIAAPQIGVNLQVVLIEVTNNPRYPTVEEIPLTVIINPTIKVLSQNKTYLWEGCLSVPGLRGNVPRYQHIYYSGYDSKGKFFEREVTNFHARVIQHEYDHLNGILMPQRVPDMRQFGFETELAEPIKKNYQAT